MPSITLIQRIALGFSALAILAIANGIFGISKTQHNLEAVQTLSSEKLPKRFHANKLQSFVYGSRMSSNIIINADEESIKRVPRERYARFATLMDEELKRLDAVLTTPEDRMAFKAINDTMREWRRYVAELIRIEDLQLEQTEYTRERELALFDATNTTLLNVIDQINGEVDLANQTTISSLQASV
ncbi:MCP four helix bundle domain-containing protein, partial [Arthrospira platensis SPKY1]|nr:MCP four helix bundle domain-containing protein [Arthrospira platensis SPKY1]